MERLRRNLVAIALATVPLGCGDDPVEPPAAPQIRTLLVHRQNTGENILLRTDGSPVEVFSAATAGLVPVGSGPLDRIVALAGFDGVGVLVLTTVDAPNRLDTVLTPLPTSMSLVSFSPDERYVSLVSYAPERVVLVYDRADGSVDSLPLGNADPALPPVLSPDNDRVGLFTVTDLSMFLTVLSRSDPTRTDTDQVGFSPVLIRPAFGWPIWTETGIQMAFVLPAGDGPDTLLIGVVIPDDPERSLGERYRAVMAPVSDQRPEARFIGASTYAFARGGGALVLGADPGTGSGRHALFLVTPDVDRVQLLLDDPEQFPVFPLFLD